jgi:hydroxymethylbilane synthase
MITRKSIVLGTRGSRLALLQAQYIANELKRLYPFLSFRVEKIRTEGDKPSPSVSLGKGMFVKELEVALVKEEIDVAVHSFKDVPTSLLSGLTIAAVSQREDPRDVLVSRRADSLDMLPHGARMGTGSLRRAAQIKAIRPDLTILDIRGNVNTRLEKLRQGYFDGIIMAAAGMIRLSLTNHITQYLPLHTFLPCPGQGALAVEVRKKDEEMKELLSSLNHESTAKAIMAERAFLQSLGGGCRTPIAALGKVDNSVLRLTGMVADPDGKRLLRLAMEGDAGDPEKIGMLLGQKLLDMGAREILDGK